MFDGDEGKGLWALDGSLVCADYSHSKQKLFDISPDGILTKSGKKMSDFKKKNDEDNDIEKNDEKEVQSKKTDTKDVSTSKKGKKSHDAESSTETTKRVSKKVEEPTVMKRSNKNDSALKDSKKSTKKAEKKTSHSRHTSSKRPSNIDDNFSEFKRKKSHSKENINSSESESGYRPLKKKVVRRQSAHFAVAPPLLETTVSIYPDIDNPNDMSVRMSREPTHTAPQVKLSSDGLTIFNEKVNIR